MHDIRVVTRKDDRRASYPRNGNPARVHYYV